MTTRIIGTGSCVAGREVTNHELSTMMETSDEWIRSRTGIGARRIAVGETTTSMSVKACEQAMEHAGIAPGDVDLVIAATISGDMCLPSTACEIQGALGLKNAVAFDVNAACAGFMYALHTAHAYISAGIYRTALLVGAETLSKMMDWNDRSTCVLFGDGAGAVVVRADETHGILAVDQGSDGAKGSVLACASRPVNNPFVENPMDLAYVSMDGQAVFKFALRVVPASIKRVVEGAGYKIEDIKYFLLHQANMRIIEGIAKRLGLSQEKLPNNIENYANMSAASVPVLLHEVNDKGMLKPGDLVVMSGFGAGLTWGSAVMKW